MKGIGSGCTTMAIVIVLLITLLSGCVSAKNHNVGGLTGWRFNSKLQDWADSTTFYTGDNLVFKYEPVHDVLEVNRGDFRICRTTKPILKHTDGGNTKTVVVTLTGPGPKFFIDGRRGHCVVGLRIRVQVLPRHCSSSSSSGSTTPLRPAGDGAEELRCYSRHRPRPHITPPSTRDEQQILPPNGSSSSTFYIGLAGGFFILMAIICLVLVTFRQRQPQQVKYECIHCPGMDPTEDEVKFEQHQRSEHEEFQYTCQPCKNRFCNPRIQLVTRLNHMH